VGKRGIMGLIIDRANIDDINELIGLYLTIYGKDYPLEVGTNKDVMKKHILDKDQTLWLLMRDTDSSTIAASCIFELDLEYKIGKITGMTVNRSYRGRGLAKQLLGAGIDEVLHVGKKVHSLYATSRTIEVSSQKMLIANGLKPLGIFPNARKIKHYETLTLMGIFGEGVLERRSKVERVPPQMIPLYDSIGEVLGSEGHPDTGHACPVLKSDSSIEVSEDDFEYIDAPMFVKKRFEETFKGDKESIFYPFHKPNLIISSEKCNLEIFASFSKKDHYCVLITANNSIRDLEDQFKQLIFSMKEKGIYYIETLMRADYYEVICFLLQNKFLPSALYPAMREEDGVMHDYVLLTRTMVPLDFSETHIDDCFLPFVNQYVEQWVEMNLKSLGVNK
jgi:GNAT superfamily N-acetyltransferase